MDRPTKPIRLDQSGADSDHDDDRRGGGDSGFTANEPGSRKTGRRQSRLGERLSSVGDRLSRSSARVSLSAMNISTMKRSWLPPLIHLAYNPLTMAGLFLVNATAVFWLFVLPVATQEGARHPYLLIVFFGILPIAFLVGLCAIPLGITRHYRRTTRNGVQVREFEPLGWDNREFRRMAFFIVGATCCNVLVGGYLSQHTVHYMDSPDFCSTTCHSMSPQYVAYQDSPHRNIDCVECHIGSGRRAYARAKLNGLWQVAANLFELYPKPIPTPLENLRPAREICESCHWPRSFSGVQVRVLDHFAQDSANTHTKTVIVLRIGGGPVTIGIHGAHLASGELLEFVAADRRKEILWVRHTDSTGTVTEYHTEQWDPGAHTVQEVRTMDCLDCHTRPSHRFKTATRAIDEALALGEINADLPWIRKYGLSVLRAGYADAAREIPESLANHYRADHPGLHETLGDVIVQAGEDLVAIHSRNVFPTMGIGWGTYPDHSGHTDSPGCFRCHGSGLSNAEGKSISADCSLCHVVLAMRESEPEILAQLGIEP